MFRRKRSGGDFQAEIEAHLELEADELRGEGVDEAEAYRRARVAFGNVAASRERFHLRHRLPWLDNLLRDLLFALRQLARNPMFGVVVVGTLALGIGASVAIFSVAHAVLLRPLPYPEPQQILRVWEQGPGGHRSNFAESNYEDFAAQNRSFRSFAAYDFALVSLAGGSEPVRATVSAVSKDFFGTFGVPPMLGRVFVAEEQIPHGSRAMVVSYGFWQRYLGSATDLSRLQLHLEGDAYAVVGVMPPTFDFPTGASAWISRELVPAPASRSAHNWRVIGRLRSGVTVEQGRQDLGVIARRLRSQYGSQVDLSDAYVATLSDAIVGDLRRSLLMLVGAVALLLLVACANVAGLLVARTSARGREFALRAALGAGRARLLQQFLVEAFVLCLAAGLTGVLLAEAFLKLLPSILPADLPRGDTISLDPAVLGFALAVTIAVTVVLGVMAAWRTGGKDGQGTLSEGLRTHGGSAANQQLRRVLIVSEMAITLIILVAAGLLGRSFLKLVKTSPGFDSENLLTLQFLLPTPSAGLDKGIIVGQTRLLDELMSRMRRVPGVTGVGLAGAIPAAEGDNLADGTFLILNGQPPPADFEGFGRMSQDRTRTGHALYAVASGGYFETLGIPLLEGRLFGDQDSIDSVHVALISKALAQRQWPTEDPIGKQIEFGNMDGNLRPLTVVGVVGDVRASGLDAEVPAVVYVDYAQRGMTQNAMPTILLRVSSPGGRVSSQAQAIIRSVVPNVPVDASTLTAALGGWLAERRFLLLLIGFFAASSLLLAAVGLYGVVGFFVTRRTQEIGIRMAMGAQRRDILWLILREAARLTALGVAAGLVISLALTRVMASLVFGISESDPLTFAGVAALLLVVALGASLIPASRAMRLDPVHALRQQ